MAKDFKSCCRQHLWLIHMVMSSKPKEEIQLETMKYLMSNKPILLEFLKGEMNSTDDKSDSVVKLGTEIDESVCSNSVKRLVSNNKKERTHTVAATEEHHAANNNPDCSNGVDDMDCDKCSYVPSKKKSKYDDIDFSHIHKEPKLKRKKSNRKQMIKPKRKTSTRKGRNSCPETQQVCSIGSMPKSKSLKQNECVFVDEANMPSIDDDEKVVCARKMVGSLVQSKCKQDQERILDVLKADEQLRLIFCKESSHLRKIKIPIFRNKNIVDLQTESHTQSGRDSMNKDSSFTKETSMGMQEDDNLDRLIAMQGDLSLFFDFPMKTLDEIQLIVNPEDLKITHNENMFVPTTTTTLPSKNYVRDKIFTDTGNVAPSESIRDDNIEPNLDLIRNNGISTNISCKTAESVPQQANDDFSKSFNELQIQQIDREQYLQNNLFMSSDMNLAFTEQYQNYTLTQL